MKRIVRLLLGIVIALAGKIVYVANAYGDAIREHGDTHVVKLTVTPADEPQPAFRYRLSLRPHELQPGNATAHYRRGFVEIQDTMDQVVSLTEADVWDWLDEPISELPLNEVRAASEVFRPFVNRFLKPGTECRDCDWGLWTERLSGRELIAFPTFELQEARQVTRLCCLETRLAIAEGRFDDAVELMRMNFRLGRDMAREPNAVWGLVGNAIAGVALGSVEDFVAAPGAPNLYWALRELPTPLVPLRDGVREEFATVPRLFPLLDRPETQQMHTDEWNARWVRLYESAHEIENGALPSWEMRWRWLGQSISAYAHAKQRLIQWGWNVDDVQRMPVGQVLAIFIARVYQDQADTLEKATYLPLYQAARPKPDAARDRDIEIASKLILHEALMPTENLDVPEVRLARDVAALQVIEALRMHAARHEGQLPGSLADVDCVPIPRNPATGREFVYFLEGETARLELPASELRGPPSTSRRYEITIAK